MKSATKNRGRPKKTFRGRMRAAIAFAVLFAVALIVLFLLGWLSDRAAGAAVFAAVVIMACSFVGHVGGRQPTRHAQRLCLSVAGALFIVALVPMLSRIFPGTPTSYGTFQSVGDKIAVPAGAEGPMHLLITSQSSDNTRTTITGLQEDVFVALQSVRYQDRHAVIVPVTVPPDTEYLELARLEGQGPIKVEVYESILGRWIVLAMLLGGLMFSATVDTLLGLRGRIVIPAAMVSVFSLAVSASATPVSVLHPTFVSLLPSLPLGALVGFASRGFGQRVARLVRRKRRSGERRLRSKK